MSDDASHHARRSPIERLRDEGRFLTTLGLGFVVVGLTYRIPWLAAWVGFALAGYSVVANDSIQTIGTFLSSNSRTRWHVLWLFVAGVFAVTTVYGWATHSGDVSYGRLSAKGFQHAPTSFSYLQLAAPLFLLVLTRLRMPVSTTFLILSSFASKAQGIKAVLLKSLSGYGVAFVSALLLWPILTPITDRMIARQREAHPAWRAAQWITTGFLWSVWLMQDAANVAVYLPRSLSLGAMLAYVSLISFGLALLVVQRGGSIQGVVSEKSNVLDVRPATLIDLVYGAILYVFKVISKVPMSTTWVFIGLLGGRELVINLVTREDRRSLRDVGRIIARDVMFASIGLVVSLLLAVLINPVVREALLG
ncbi:MAG: hypothetical protein KC503_28225 [Myxococcales bacterium]|nr:hypothetical protein [Myxococcales bacterium]